MGQFISDASGATAAGDGTTDRSPLFERCSLRPSPPPDEPGFKRVNFVDPHCTLQFYVMFNDVLYTTKRLFAGNVIRLLWPIYCSDPYPRQVCTCRGTPPQQTSCPRPTLEICVVYRNEKSRQRRWWEDAKTELKEIGLDSSGSEITTICERSNEFSCSENGRNFLCVFVYVWEGGDSSLRHKHLEQRFSNFR